MTRLELIFLSAIYALVLFVMTHVLISMLLGNSIEESLVCVFIPIMFALPWLMFLNWSAGEDISDDDWPD